MIILTVLVELFQIPQIGFDRMCRIVLLEGQIIAELINSHSLKVRKQKKTRILKNPGLIYQITLSEFFLILQPLNVPCLEDLLTLVYGRFGKLLATSQLAHSAGTIEFALESL